jgi:hypothetical protein
MSDAITLHAERKDDGFWTYLRRSAGELPRTPLHSVLEWVLEQMNFGNFEVERDSRGDVVSVTIGRAAAMEHVSDDEAIEKAKRRLSAVNFAGICDHPDPRFRPLGAGDHPANVIVVDGTSLSRPQRYQECVGTALLSSSYF